MPYDERYVEIDNSSLPFLYFHGRGETYDHAMEACRLHHNGTLAVLKDKDIAERVERFFPKHMANYYRIGLRKASNNDVYRWADGSVFEPTTLGTPRLNEGCQSASAYKTSRGDLRLRAMDCGRKMAYVCESSDVSTAGGSTYFGMTGLRLGLSVAIGAGVLVCLLLVIGFVLNTRSRSKKRKREEKEMEQTPTKKRTESNVVILWEDTMKTLNRPEKKDLITTEDDYVSVNDLAPPKDHLNSLQNPLYGSQVFIYSMADDVPEKPIYSQVKKKNKYDSY